MGVHIWFCKNCQKETGHEVREQAHHDPRVRALTSPPKGADDYTECTCTECGHIEWVDPFNIFQFDRHDFGD